jgi:hypothetical protein
VAPRVLGMADVEIGMDDDDDPYYGRPTRPMR